MITSFTLITVYEIHIYTRKNTSHEKPAKAVMLGCGDACRLSHYIQLYIQAVNSRQLTANNFQ